MAIKHGLRAQNYTCPLENHIILLGTSKVQSQLSFWLLKSVMFSTSRLINVCSPFSANLLYINNRALGTSLVVQWLKCCASNAGGMGLIPGQGTKIPYAMLCSQINQSIKTLIKKNRALGSIPSIPTCAAWWWTSPSPFCPLNLRVSSNCGSNEMWHSWACKSPENLLCVTQVSSKSSKETGWIF